MVDPNIHRVDVRTVLVGLGLIVTVAGVTAGLSRFAWQSDIQRAVDFHSLERGQWRQQVDSKFSRLEEQCSAHKEWREDASDQLKDLHRWHSNCSEKQATVTTKIEEHDRKDDAEMMALKRRMDWIEGMIMKSKRE